MVYTKKTVARPQAKTGLSRIVVKTKLETYVQYTKPPPVKAPEVQGGGGRPPRLRSLRLRPKRKTGRQKIAANTIIISSREGLKPVISFSSHVIYRVHSPEASPLSKDVPFRSLLQILIYSEKFCRYCTSIPLQIYYSTVYAALLVPLWNSLDPGRAIRTRHYDG